MKAVRRHVESTGSELEAAGMEEVVDILFEVGGDLVQGGEGRRSFIGLEEGDEFGGRNTVSNLLNELKC